MASSDVALEEIPKIIVYCLAIIALQGVLLFALRKWGAILFTLFAVVNTYSLYVVFAGQEVVFAGIVLGGQKWSWIVHFAILLALIAFYFVLLQIVLLARGLRPWIFGSLYLTVVLMGLFSVAPLAREPALADADPDLKNIRILDFERKPNIYFLGFDALMPRALTRKLLEIDAPAYLDVLAKHNGKIIPNLFADEVPTKLHWARVMTILPLSKGRPGDYLLGLRPTALLEILRHNGYETHFSYSNGYFGPKKGPLLTTYAFRRPYSTCTFLRGNAAIYGFLGYCALYRTGWFDAVESAVLDEFYMDRLRVATRATKSKPQFFAAHYQKPDHTPSTYQGTKVEFEEYRDAYQAGSVKAAKLMDRMLNEIRSTDSKAIALVFGDHGPYTLRGHPYQEDPEGVVQSRHGIMGVVFGADECMPFMLPKAGEKYQTFARVVAGLLQCLSGGTSPLRKDIDFGKIIRAPDLRFEDYVYE